MDDVTVKQSNQAHLKNFQSKNHAQTAGELHYLIMDFSSFDNSFNTYFMCNLLIYWCIRIEDKCIGNGHLLAIKVHSYDRTF